MLLIRWAMIRTSWRLAIAAALYQLALTLSLKVIPVTWLPFNTAAQAEWDPHIGLCLLSGVFLIICAAWMVRRRFWALSAAVTIYAVGITIGWSQLDEPLNSAVWPKVFSFSIPVLTAILLLIGFGGLPLIAAIVFAAKSVRSRQPIRQRLVAIVVAIGIYAIAMVILWSQPPPLTTAGEWRVQLLLPRSILNMALVVFGGLPFIAAMVFTVKSLRNRRWKRLGFFGLATIAMAIRLAADRMSRDAHRMAADERYMGDGWYLVLIYGVYLAGCLVLVVWAAKPVFRFFKQKAIWLDSKLYKVV
jgi:hypothetical protein